ncbi:glycosyltransferase family 2 protein [Falsirhodobacter sp. 20TX0035]|uniref:glycosyltransferase family 2 protein n=1 Tax=Falsirhodobacter sp. 20TX0035 TaxID=3022019 RepID=UPI00232FBDA9|nr:glycosyltransferase [Falsirhodobacter sp. 20TX0035]MDB6454791.1 glycosyltransferase [Falsirhodobacter sp. 20TX0035]
MRIFGANHDAPAQPICNRLPSTFAKLSERSRMKQRISVILPTYNRASLIGETIESLLAQTRKPDEILVIDDGSTDGTAEVLAGYEGLRVVRIPNGGKASALNLAMGMISGDLVWIVDDDDLLLPEACAALSAPLEADEDLGFCAGRHIDFEVDPASGQKVTRPPGYMRDSAPDQIFPDLLEGCHIFQPGLMVRRRVYDAVGPFDTSLVRSQDYEMLLRIARSHRGLQLPDTVFLHREHKGTRGTATTSFAASRNSDMWAVYNRIIFELMLAGLSDAQLIAASDLDAVPQPLHARAARIKRGCVLARQRMWPEAVAAWREAAGMQASALSGLERDMLARSPNSALGAPELFASAEVRAGLLALSRMPGPGPEIVAVLRRAARWHVRAAIKARDWRCGLNGARFLLGR